jgi:ribosomal protein L10
MSKTVKGMIIREYKSRLTGMEDATLISIRGISSNDTNKIRGTLRKKNIRVTMVQNALARKAFEGTGLEGLAPLMKGANAIAYGGNSVVEVARELVKLFADFPLIEMKGANLDGQHFEGENPRGRPCQGCHTARWPRSQPDGPDQGAGLQGRRHHQGDRGAAGEG